MIKKSKKKWLMGYYQSRGYIRRIFGYLPITLSQNLDIRIFESAHQFDIRISEYQIFSISVGYPSNIRQIPITITIHHSCNILILFNIKHYFITTIKDNFYFQRIFYIIQVFFKLFVQKELD